MVGFLFKWTKQKKDVEKGPPDDNLASPSDPPQKEAIFEAGPGLGIKVDQPKKKKDQKYRKNTDICILCVQWTLGLLFAIFVLAPIVLPIASLALSENRDTSVLEVYKLYDPEGAQWMNKYSSTTAFCTFWLVGLVILAFCLFLSYIFDNGKPHLSCMDMVMALFLFIFAIVGFLWCVKGIGQSWGMPDILSEQILAKKMKKAMINFQRFPGTNQEWNVTEEHFNCHGLYTPENEGCYDQLYKAIHDLYQTSFQCILLAYIPVASLLLILCLINDCSNF